MLRLAGLISRRETAGSLVNRLHHVLISFDQMEKKNVSISLITWSCDSGFSWFLSFVRVMKKKKCQQKPK